MILLRASFCPHKIYNRYAEPSMPNVDGCIQVMEAGMMQGGGGTYAKDIGQWYGDGVMLSLHFAADVMQNVLKDPLLRKYSR